MANQHIQEALKKFQDKKRKNMKNTKTNKWTYRSLK
jgi:hypothetical protein